MFIDFKERGRERDIMGKKHQLVGCQLVARVLPCAP